MSASVLPEGASLPEKEAWNDQEAKPSSGTSSGEADGPSEAELTSCMKLSDNPDIESHAQKAHTEWELDSVVSTIEEPSIYVLMWAMAAGDNRGVPKTDSISRWGAKFLTLLTALIQVLIPFLMVYLYLKDAFASDGGGWKDICPGYAFDPYTKYCDDEAYADQWLDDDDLIKSGADPNRCDDDYLHEYDDVYPGDIKEYNFGQHDRDGYLIGTMAFEDMGHTPVHQVTLGGSMGGQEGVYSGVKMYFEHFAHTQVNITLNKAILEGVIMNTFSEYWTRETRYVVILEKMTAFILSVYLSSSIVSTIQEAWCFLKLAHVFRRGSAFSERFWLYLGVTVQMMSVLMIVLATQLLFIDSPTMADQLLNCVALNFLVEVDNSIVNLTQAFPGFQAFDIRSKFVTGHIVENWETSTERASYVQDLNKLKKDKSFKNVSKPLYYFQWIYIIYIFFVTAISVLGSICISNSQYHNH